MDLMTTGLNNYKNSTVDSSLNADVRGASSKNDKELRKATRDFEALFIKQMLNSMRKTVPKDGMLDGGMGKDIFEDMLYDEYSKQMANTANLGISDMMFKQLSTQKPEI